MYIFSVILSCVICALCLEATALTPRGNRANDVTGARSGMLLQQNTVPVKQEVADISDLQAESVVQTALAITPFSSVVSTSRVDNIMPEYNGVAEFNTALDNVRSACVGINVELADLKKMAGINTAITGVGTAAGAGATAVGLVKSKKDKQIEELERLLEEIKKMNEESEQDPLSVKDSKDFLKAFEADLDAVASNKYKYESELDKLNKQSKNLGNWRTGLMAGSTVTNVAGAVIAGGNKTEGGLRDSIQKCLEAVKVLDKKIGQARIDGANVSQALEIVRVCGEYERVDLDKIDNRAKGAMISSVVGATAGLSGTVTSVMANTDKTRNDNTESGKQKEKSLNVASNVLAGTTTVASAAATAFNAAQISAIKKVSDVADNCDKELAK